MCVLFTLARPVRNAFMHTIIQTAQHAPVLSLNPPKKGKSPKSPENTSSGIVHLLSDDEESSTHSYIALLHVCNQCVCVLCNTCRCILCCLMLLLYEKLDKTLDATQIHKHTDTEDDVPVAIRLTKKKYSYLSPKTLPQPLCAVVLLITMGKIILIVISHTPDQQHGNCYWAHTTGPSRRIVELRLEAKVRDSTFNRWWRQQSVYCSSRSEFGLASYITASL